jgi:hypothetical protein
VGLDEQLLFYFHHQFKELLDEIKFKKGYTFVFCRIYDMQFYNGIYFGEFHAKIAFD